MDDHYHGALVSGVVGADDNNNGVVGIAPLVRKHGLKILDYRSIGLE